MLPILAAQRLECGRGANVTWRFVRQQPGFILAPTDGVRVSPTGQDHFVELIVNTPVNIYGYLRAVMVITL